MNILLMLAHSIEEHDQIRLLSGLGYDVFSIGGYIDPAEPHDPKRPALPNAPRHPELRAIVDGLGTDNNMEAAKCRLPDDLIDWADAIICHHYEHRWLVPQWNRLRHKRIIWRTVGQSVAHNEQMMRPFREDGLQIVRYSPRERNIPGYAGEDALIRFYKDPDEWGGWIGDKSVVINITQHLRQRDPYTNWRYWEVATAGLPRAALGPGSEVIGGPGELSLPEMQEWLRRARVYLYTGTQPASYTLGLIEAAMTGIPVVSIGPKWMDVFPYGPDLFEGWEFASDGGPSMNDPAVARALVRDYLNDHERARCAGILTRDRAIKTFGMETVGRQWREFLG